MDGFSEECADVRLPGSWRALNQRHLLREADQKRTSLCVIQYDLLLELQKALEISFRVPLQFADEIAQSWVLRHIPQPGRGGSGEV